MASSSSDLQYDETQSIDFGRNLDDNRFFRGTLKNVPVAVRRIKRKDIRVKEEELRDLHHPNVLKLLYVEDYGYDARLLALELCAATLDTVFLPEDDRRKYTGPIPNHFLILLQLAKGLEYIHSKDLVHGDIGPHSVFITACRPVVVKWGTPSTWSDCRYEQFLRNLREKQKKDRFIHPDWFVRETEGILMPPEVFFQVHDEHCLNFFEVKKAITKKSDIFSAGGLFWKILASEVDRLASYELQYELFQVYQKDMDDMNIRFYFLKTNEPISHTETISKSFISSQISSESELSKSLVRVRFPYGWNGWRKVINAKFSSGHPMQEVIEGMLHPDPELRVKMEEVSNVLQNTVNEAAFHYLCRYCANDNLIDNVRWLIQKGTNVNCKNSNGTTPLHYLCRYYKNDNLIDVVRLLIETGAEVNCKDTDGMTPLLYLCRDYRNDNLIDIVSLLVEKGADVNCKDSDGTSFLHYLCQYYKNDNLIDIVSLLVEKGADVNCKRSNGTTPLYILCLCYEKDNLIDIVRLLVENGADVNSMKSNEATPLYVLCLFYKNKNGNLIDIMHLLIEKGADLNCKDSDGTTLLHNLCLYYEKDDLIDIVRLLVEKGADVNCKDSDVTTLLHYMCQYYEKENFIDIVRVLIDKGADVNCKDSDGKTLLHFLCQYYEKDNFIDIVRLLVEKGADVNCNDSDGMTPLHYLCRYYKNDNLIDIVSLLVETGADVNCKDFGGMTSLRYLCDSYKGGNLIDIIRLLVGNGLDLNLQDIEMIQKKIEKMNPTGKGQVNIPGVKINIQLALDSSQQKQLAPVGTYQMLRGNLAGIPVAVKRVSLDDCSFNAKSGTREKNLIRLAQENLRSIVRLFHYEDFEGFRTYAFEWSEGSLDQVFLPDNDERKYRGPPLPSPATVLLQLANGLAFLHSIGEFHGDIKPQSALIFVGGTSTQRIYLKWSDFGLYVDVGLTHHKDEFGLSGIKRIFPWQPKEIILQYSELLNDGNLNIGLVDVRQKILLERRLGSVKADMFSVGCLFFYYLTKGTHPFGQSINIPGNILSNNPINMTKMPRSHYTHKLLKKMMDPLPMKRGKLDDFIQQLEEKRKTELHDLCFLCHPTDEDIDLMGRLVATNHEEKQLVGINEPNKDGYTPLILLVRNNRDESLLRCIQTLLDSIKEDCGITSNNVINTKDQHGFYPLHYLNLNYGHSNLWDIVQLLLDKGLDLKLMDDRQSRKVIEFLCMNYNHPNLLDITQLLFDNGLSLKKAKSKPIEDEKVSKRPMNALEFLCSHYKKDNLLDIAHLLLNKGIDKDHSNCQDSNCPVKSLAQQIN